MSENAGQHFTSAEVEDQQVAITKSTDRGQQRNRFMFYYLEFLVVLFKIDIFLYAKPFWFMMIWYWKFLDFTPWLYFCYLWTHAYQPVLLLWCCLFVVLLWYIYVCPHHLSLPVDEMGVMMNSIKEGGVSLTGQEQPFTHDHFRRSFIRRCKNPVINEKVHVLRTLQSTLKVSADWAGQRLTTVKGF